jgi:hypothetical protein
VNQLKQNLPALPRAIAQYICVLSVVLWLGSFSVYSAFIVRVGAKVVGGLEQGYVTQKVTDGLNVLAAVMLVCLAIDILLHRKYIAKLLLGLRGLSLITIAISLVLLLYFHNQLDALLDPETLDKPIHAKFSPLHQNYQMTITFMWCACIADLAIMLHGHRAAAVAKAKSLTDASQQVETSSQLGPPNTSSDSAK